MDLNLNRPMLPFPGIVRLKYGIPWMLTQQVLGGNLPNRAINHRSQGCNPQFHEWASWLSETAILWVLFLEICHAIEYTFAQYSWKNILDETQPHPRQERRAVYATHPEAPFTGNLQRMPSFELSREV